MKAAVYHRYGAPEVVTLADVPTPTPRANEVLIRIRATTVTTGDWRARSLSMPAGFGLLGRLVFGVFGPRKPILGTELSGTVEALGSAVTRFAVGDDVFAFSGARYGCHAEYRTFAEDGLIAKKPMRSSFEEAAALSFGGTTALSFLRDKASIAKGERVLVVGASGGVGTAAVQIAKHFGAEVIGVCSRSNVDLVRSLGADSVIDYEREDFAAARAAYDIILDTTSTASLARCEASLRPGGRLVIVHGTFAQAIGMERPAKASGKRVIGGVAAVKPEHLRFLGSLAETGELRPVIDRTFSFDRVAEAHAVVDSGRKRGNVVMTVSRASAKENAPRARATAFTAIA